MLKSYVLSSGRLGFQEQLDMGRGKNISLQKKEEPPVGGYQASWCNCGKYLPSGKTHRTS